MGHLSRRELLLTSVAFPAAAAKMPIIDTHMHVWSLDTARYPFNPPEPNYRKPTQDGSVETYLEEMKKDGVDLAVLVQERSSGWNNNYIADCVRRFPKLFVGHGLIDPHDPNNAAVLEREVKQNGLSGMRLSPIYHPPNKYPNDQWLNASYNYPLWKKAEEIGAVFNVFMAPAQLPQLEDMVRRYPKGEDRGRSPGPSRHSAQRPLGGERLPFEARSLPQRLGQVHRALLRFENEAIPI